MTYKNYIFPFLIVAATGCSASGSNQDVLPNDARSSPNSDARSRSEDSTATGDASLVPDTPKDSRIDPADLSVVVDAVDDATTSDVSLGDGSSIPSDASLPTGATLCGSGVFSTPESAAACAEPSKMVTPMDAGTGYPRACTELTMSPGRWEVWCTSTRAYVRAEFNDVASSSGSRCTVTVDGSVVPYTLPSSIQTYQYEFFYGSYGAGGGNFLSPGPFYKPVSFVVDTEISATAMTSGRGTIWLVDEKEPCDRMSPRARSIVGGVSVKWTVK